MCQHYAAGPNEIGAADSSRADGLAPETDRRSVDESIEWPVPADRAAEGGAERVIFDGG